MNRVVAALSLTAAFAAGCGVTHFLRPALAAENITAQIIHTGELEGDALSPANAAGMRRRVSAQPHRPIGAGHGKVARLADDRRRDLGLEQHAAIFVARLFGREAP